MTMVALAAAQMLADDVDAWGMPMLRALLPIAGMTVIEQQAERARAMGATRLLIVVDGVPSGLVEACDRIRSRGLPVDLVRDGAQVAAACAALPDARQMLLVADGLVGGARAWQALASATADASSGALVLPLLLSVPDEFATQDLERLDAESRWAGIALLPVRATSGLADAPADWDPQLTLLRQAVQQGVARLACDPAWFVSGEMQLASTPGGAAEAEERMLSQQAATHSGLAGRWLWAPVLRLFAPQLLAGQIGGRVARLGAILSAIAAGGSALAGWLWPMVALGLIAAGCHATAGFIAGFRPESKAWQWAGRAAIAAQWLALVLADRHMLADPPGVASVQQWAGGGGMALSFAVLLGVIVPRLLPEKRWAIVDMAAAWALAGALMAVLDWRTAWDWAGVLAMALLIGNLLAHLRQGDGAANPSDPNLKSAPFT